MEFFDTDGDGKITQDEFMKTLETICKQHNYTPTQKDKDIAIRLFKKADKDNSEFVDMSELKDAIAWVEKNF